ncbi:MAG: 16S rRNA (guanine(966)-N(2))-methyltransferase RsmD [Ruminococcaceae bacterium]|nr:16S rRNA (guanine(966)-N(2))-methyltransferase RsmD [Oscillospiraceae bacterium]
MRVITGIARGTRLRTLDGDSVRPTTEKVKEAVFSAIHFELENANVLDLFAGSGQMGIEALSRGAAKAVFCDSSSQAINIINENLKNTKLEDNAKVIKGDFTVALCNNDEKYDICFLDPPYYSGHYDKALNLLKDKMKPYGKVICEHPADVELSDEYGFLKKQKDYRFSNIIISKYCMEVPENEE